MNIGAPESGTTEGNYAKDLFAREVAIVERQNKTCRLQSEGFIASDDPRIEEATKDPEPLSLPMVRDHSKCCI